VIVDASRAQENPAAGGFRAQVRAVAGTKEKTPIMGLPCHDFDTGL